MNMFEQAAREALRFETSKGLVNTEDLWLLPLTGDASLDDLAKLLNRQIKDSNEESFVIRTNPINRIPKLKFEIVKYIISVKLNEQEEATQRADKKVRKEKLLSILATKEDSELEGKSSEEIRALIEELS